MEGLETTLSAVVGGILVLAGDWVRQRRRDRLENFRLAVDAAANVLATTRESVAAARAARRSGAHLTVAEAQELHQRDRAAATRFWMLPLPERARAYMRTVGETAWVVMSSTSAPDPSWERAEEDFAAAVFRMEQLMRDLQGASRRQNSLPTNRRSR